MDPVSQQLVLAGVKQALDAASGEAGKQAWQGFVTLVRRAFGRPDAVVEPDEVEELAGAVSATARRDPAFAAELREWLALADGLRAHDDSVTNVIGGEARITGNVVQARDISGPITFH